MITSTLPLEAQVNAIFHAMPFDIRLNDDMRIKIAVLFALAAHAFKDDPPVLDVDVRDARRIRPQDWPLLDDAFACGLKVDVLSPSQRHDWRIAIEATRRIIQTGIDLD